MALNGPETVFLELEDSRWQALATSDPRAHIFHHPAWAGLLAACYGYRPFVAAAIDGNGNLRAGLPMIETRSPVTGRRWTSLPFTDHCAPLDCGVDEQTHLVDGLVRLSQDHRIPRTELRWEFQLHPAIRSSADQVLHLLPLGGDSEAVAARFHATHRRNIKLAEKRGVRVEWGAERKHLEAFYRLHLQTRRRQGIPVQPWKFFEMLGSRLIEQGLGFVLLAYQDDQCLAAAVFLRWQRTLTYKYGASALDGLNLRPNNLLFWSAIRWGCEHGYTTFDMGKTDLANTGLRAFKSGWGAVESPLVYSAIPVHHSRSAAGSLMPVMQKVIRNSPPWMCRAMGEALYKYFG